MLGKNHLRFGFPLVLLILFLAPSAQTAEVPGDGWRELKDTHFIVYYVEGHPGATKVLRAAERYYGRIAKNLGYERRKNFWLFDERCQIYVYPTRELFHQFQPQAPVWSGGFADYAKKQIIGYLDSADFLTTALPHEIAHLILRDYLGKDVEVPMWVDEGVALSQEEIRRSQLEELVWKSLDDRTFIPIEKLTTMRVELAKHHAEVKLYYAQAALLIEFLIGNSKKNEFVEFCRGLRDGLDTEQALTRGYHGRLKSVKQLEGAFLNELATQFK